MADIADLAEGMREENEKLSLRYRKPTGPIPSMDCSWCGRGMVSIRLFCDSDCSEDYEKNLKFTSMRGKAR